MKNQVNYKKASSYYLIGNIFNKGISFLTVPIFTRILSTYDYGIINTYNSWVGILAMVMGFALHMGIRAAFIDYQEKIDDVMTTITAFTFISAVSIGGILLFVMNVLPINVNTMLVFLCLLQGFATAIIDDYLMYLMMQYRYRFRTMLMILPNFISAFLSMGVIIFVMKSNQYLGRIIPTCMVYLMFSVCIIILIFIKNQKIHWNYLSYALKISAPLIVHGIALNILSQSDRMMITWLADASETGIYSLVYNFGMISMVITTSFEGVWVPWFTTKLKQESVDTINRLAVSYVNFMTYVMVGFILVGPEALKLLASKQYWEGISIIPAVVISNYLIFIYTLYVNVEHFYKKTPYITLNTVIAAGTNLVLNYIFIPKFGYTAAAYTTMISYLLSFALHARYSKKLVADLYPFRMFIRPLLHLFVVTLTFYLFLPMPVIRFGVLLLYMIWMFMRERKQILDFFPEIRQRWEKKQK